MATSDERAAFEAAMQAQGYKPYNFGVAMVGGPYRNSHVQAAYEGWQARAAQQAPQARAEWHLNEEQAALLRDTIGEEASPITLSVGPVTDDGGTTETGLRVYLTEYPEEGAVLLAANPQIASELKENET